MIRLITYDRSSIQPGYEHVVAEFEESIAASEGVAVVTQNPIVLEKIPQSAWRNRKASGPLPFSTSGDASFSVLMGPAFEKMFPYCLLTPHRNAYMFDVWPSRQPYIAAFLREAAMSHVFYSSRQAAEMMGRLVPTTGAHWVPEGILPSRYRAYAPERRDIDVLQFGRKYQALHEQIVGPLAAHSLTYLYEKQKGDRVFATEAAFVDGLARAKISICVPCSVTHPEIAGHVSTMTVRYLQSMVSKCLVLGTMPEEMKALFPYDPIVELDRSHPVDQILDLLRNYHRYTALIERNYQYVLEHHTWTERWKAIRPVLAGSSR